LTGAERFGVCGEEEELAFAGDRELNMLFGIPEELGSDGPGDMDTS
jgi:hypothetical protein